MVRESWSQIFTKYFYGNNMAVHQSDLLQLFLWKIFEKQTTKKEALT